MTNIKGMAMPHEQYGENLKSKIGTTAKKSDLLKYEYDASNASTTDEITVSLKGLTSYPLAWIYFLGSHENRTGVPPTDGDKAKILSQVASDIGPSGDDITATGTTTKTELTINLDFGTLGTTTKTTLFFYYMVFYDTSALSNLSY